MRILLINVKGHGIDLTINKLTKEQYNSTESHITKLPTLFQLFGVKAENLEIEVIDEDGEVLEVYEYDDLKMCEVSHLDNERGYFQFAESYEKGLFYQFELFLVEDEKFDVDLLTLETKEYDGEEYVFNVLYDNDPLESIKTDTTIIEMKIKKIYK